MDPKKRKIGFDPEDKDPDTATESCEKDEAAKDCDSEAPEQKDSEEECDDEEGEEKEEEEEEHEEEEEEMESEEEEDESESGAEGIRGATRAVMMTREKRRRAESGESAGGDSIEEMYTPGAAKAAGVLRDGSKRTQLS